MLTLNNITGGSIGINVITKSDKHHDISVGNNRVETGIIYANYYVNLYVNEISLQVNIG